MTKTISLFSCIVVTLFSNLVTYQITRSLLLGAGSWRESSINFVVPSNSNRGLLTVDEYNMLAYNHSVGFFDTIPNHLWTEFYQKPVLEHLALPAPNDDTTNVSQWLYDNMNPAFNCPHPKKIGNPGGKILCDPERWVRLFTRRRVPSGEMPCLIYSIGSKGNFRFEEGFLGILDSETLCEFHIFDPSPVYESAETLQKHPHWHYHSWGLRGVESTKNYTRRRDRFFDLPTIRKRLGHEHRPIDILKIDCEGCEWESMPDWLFSNNASFSFDFPDMHHLLLETHSIPLPNDVRKAGNFGRFLPMPQVAYLEKAFAEKGFVLYAKEVNTHQGFGRSVEFAFVRLHEDFFDDRRT